MESSIRFGLDIHRGSRFGEHSILCDNDPHSMASFHRASHERVNVFLVDGVYLFKHYFEGKEVFDRLKQYYNNQQYRFEIPTEAFDDLQEFVAQHGYGLVVVDALEEFVVVVRKYTAHPEGIFKQSVIQRSIDGYNCFLLAERDAVQQVVTEEAVRLTETDFETPFYTHGNK
jgi:hypothetical protein